MHIPNQESKRRIYCGNNRAIAMDSYAPIPYVAPYGFR